jgi:hypothetical protein
MVSTVRRTRSVGRRVPRGPDPVRSARALHPGPGILGLDWLGAQGLVLDFARDQMRLGSIAARTDADVSVPVKATRSGCT